MGSPSKPEEIAAMSYDLSFEIGPFVDQHLMLKVLDFLEEKKVYVDPKGAVAPEVMAGKLELLNQTNMVDFAVDYYKKTNPGKGEPEEMKKRRSDVVKEMKELKAECEPLKNLLDDTEL